jgi:Protein of unknown function (DUF3096)
MPGLVPGIPLGRAPCISKRDGRDKPGHDGSQMCEACYNRTALCAFKLCTLPPVPAHFIPNPRKTMVITAAHITPLVALIAGILILVMPRLLNLVVAIYLIIVGLMGLNAIYHWVQ